MEFTFKIPGKIKAKQSVKFGKNGIKYTPKDVIDYANWIKICFQNKYPNHKPSDLENKNLEIEINAFFKIPKSFSKTKQTQALKNNIRPTIKPDWDNISKNVCDALNCIAYPDDKAIVKGSVEKYYGEDDYLLVTLSTI